MARKLILEAGILEMLLVEGSHRMPAKAESVPTEPKAQSTGLVYHSGLSREIKPIGNTRTYIMTMTLAVVPKLSCNIEKF